MGSTVYVDSDGFEYKKNCAFKCVNNINRSYPGTDNNATYCKAYHQFLDSEPFSTYYGLRAHDCPYFVPGD